MTDCPPILRHKLPDIQAGCRFCVIQNPAILHIFSSRDLKSLLPKPYVLHNRQLTCWEVCNPMSELIIGCFDSRVAIFTLKKEKVWKADDPDSCVQFEFVEYRIAQRYDTGNRLSFTSRLLNA